MALSYQESGDLMTDIPFRQRVKVACLHFAEYILDESAATAAHNTRFRWAQGAMADPDGTASRVQSAVVMDPQVQTDGSAITDQNLQASVETAIQKML